MTAIAAEARIGKQTLYRRYPDKAALFREVMNHRIEAVTAVPDIPVNEDDPIAELRQLARCTLDAAIDRNLIALHRVLAGEVTAFPELAAYAGQWGTQHIERCEKAIARVLVLGLHPGGDPRMIASSLLWGVVGDVLYRAIMGEITLRTMAERDHYFEAKWAVSIFGAVGTAPHIQSDAK
jgi:AcrR family transcriptional regulator